MKNVNGKLSLGRSRILPVSLINYSNMESVENIAICLAGLPDL
jgi:hypothetical protein